MYVRMVECDMCCKALHTLNASPIAIPHRHNCSLVSLSLIVVQIPHLHTIMSSLCRWMTTGDLQSHCSSAAIMGEEEYIVTRRLGIGSWGSGVVYGMRCFREKREQRGEGIQSLRTKTSNTIRRQNCCYMLVGNILIPVENKNGLMMKNCCAHQYSTRQIGHMIKYFTSHAPFTVHAHWRMRSLQP